MTKAHLCREAPLAVLMRIKGLWVHGSGAEGGLAESLDGTGWGCSLRANIIQESGCRWFLPPSLFAIGGGINSLWIKEN